MSCSRSYINFVFLLAFQVVTLALYTYFIAALLGRQFVPDATGPVGKFEEPDVYFPFFTALQVNNHQTTKF